MGLTDLARSLAKVVAEVKIAPVALSDFGTVSKALIAANGETIGRGPANGDLVYWVVCGHGRELAEVDAVPLMLDDNPGSVAVFAVDVDEGAVTMVWRVNCSAGAEVRPEAPSGEDAVHGGTAECREHEDWCCPAQGMPHDLLRSGLNGRHAEEGIGSV